MTERLYAAEPVVAFRSPLREEWADQLVEACVETVVGLPAGATLRFRDPAHRLLASAGIAVGVPVTVSVAVARRRTRLGIFDGEVTALETEVDVDGTFTTVRAMDRGQRLARGRRVAAYVDTTVAEVVGQAVARHGLKAGRVDAERTRIPYLAQPNLTDWELLRHLADQRGLRLSVEGDTVHMSRPAAAGGAPAPGTGADRSPFVLELGENLLALRASVSSEGQVAGVEVRGWDPAGKAAVSARAGAGDSSRLRLGVTPARLGAAFPGAAPDLLVAGRGYTAAGQVDVAAHALAQEAAASMAALSAEVAGTPELAAGVPVTLAGVGEPFAGKYTLTSCRHTFDGDHGYRTEVGVGPLPPPVVPYPPALCSLGVAVGIVTDIKEPGQGERGAVRLRLPWLSQDYVTDWARTVQWGGAGGGGVFPVEAGDEVLVCFEHGRLDRPYVLGGLYNGVDSPTDHGLPLVDSGTGRANRRSLASRSGDLVELLSAADGPQGVRLRTGDGKLTTHLDRKDSTIVLTAGEGGRTLRVSLDARGEGTVTVDAGTGGSLVLRAGTVTVTADDGKGGGGLTLKGATVNVTSTGQLSLDGRRTGITGDTVDIN